MSRISVIPTASKLLHSQEHQTVHSSSRGSSGRTNLWTDSTEGMGHLLTTVSSSPTAVNTVFLEFGRSGTAGFSSCKQMVKANQPARTHQKPPCLHQDSCFGAGNTKFKILEGSKVTDDLS